LYFGTACILALRPAKGIGWQFIRYNVICISIPTVGALALTGTLTGEAATLIAGALGYAFGKPEEKKDA